MTQYLYPQNLKATANLWLWGLRDFCILGIAALLSIVTLVQLGFFLPAQLLQKALWPVALPRLRERKTHLFLSAGRKARCRSSSRRTGKVQPAVGTER